MSYTFISLACVLVGTVWIWLKSRFSYWRRKGVREWEATSIFGNFWNLLALKGNEVDVADECYKKLGDVKFGGYYYFWKPILIVKDAEMIKNITTKDFEHFSDHPSLVDINRDTDAVLRSLFLLKAQEWKPKRAALTHFFTPKRLKTVHKAVEEICQKLFFKFDRYAQKDEDVEIESSMAEITMNIIATTFIGVDLNDHTVFRDAVALFSLPDFATVFKLILYNVHPEVHKTLRLTTLDKGIYRVFSDLVEKVISQRKKENVVTNDLFDFLIKCKNGEVKHFEDITYGEIIGHVFSFFVAGHDTTALTTAFALYELSKNKETQDKLRDNIAEEVVKHGEGLSFSVVSKIPYLNNVIQETMRMYPILGVLKRVCTKPYKLDDLEIPLDTEVVIPVRSLHYDEKYFEDPTTFTPERFKNGKAPDVFLPFGKGPRSCIGMRFAEVVMKMVITQLILNYEFLPSGKNQIPFEFEPAVIVTARPVGGVWIKMKKRSDKLIK